MVFGQGCTTNNLKQSPYVSVINKESHIEQFHVGRTDDEADLHQLEAKLLLEAFREAVKFETVLRESPRNMSDDQQKQALFHYSRFIVLFDRCGGNLTPKFHLLIHQVQEYKIFGNARYYHTYADESFNAVVAQLARASHRLCWAESIFKKLAVARGLGGLQGFC